MVASSKQHQPQTELLVMTWQASSMSQFICPVGHPALRNIDDLSRSHSAGTHLAGSDFDPLSTHLVIALV